jgi:carbon storage regulator
LLVLTRKPNQAIVIADNIRIVVLSVNRDQVRIGVDAPSELSVHREEVYADINRQVEP